MCSKKGGMATTLKCVEEWNRNAGAVYCNRHKINLLTAGGTRKWAREIEFRYIFEVREIKVLTALLISHQSHHEKVTIIILQPSLFGRCSLASEFHIVKSTRVY